jgi:hypothetical protein
MTEESRQRWSSRKFWTMNVWLAVFVGLLVLGYLSKEVFSMLAGGTLGTYLCANVAQHIWGRQ